MQHTLRPLAGHRRRPAIEARALEQEVCQRTKAHPPPGRLDLARVIVGPQARRPAPDLSVPRKVDPQFDGALGLDDRITHQFAQTRLLW